MPIHNKITQVSVSHRYHCIYSQRLNAQHMLTHSMAQRWKQTRIKRIAVLFNIDISRVFLVCFCVTTSAIVKHIGYNIKYMIKSMLFSPLTTSWFTSRCPTECLQQERGCILTVHHKGTPLKIKMFQIVCFFASYRGLKNRLRVRATCSWI